MFNPFRWWIKSQEAQLNWIRKHPIKWAALNIFLTVLLIAYLQYKDRQDFPPFDESH